MTRLNFEKLKAIRGDRSMEEIANRLGISRQAVFQFEAGERQNPTISVLYRLADAYGVDPRELILTDDQPAAA